MKTFWLSFTDPDRPKGEQFLGVAIIDVTEADAALAAAIVAARHPHAQPSANWIAAAIQRAWDTRCNPGGEIMSIDVTGEHEAEKAPHHCLLSRADLRELGLAALES